MDYTQSQWLCLTTFVKVTLIPSNTSNSLREIFHFCSLPFNNSLPITATLNPFKAKAIPMKIPKLPPLIKTSHSTVPKDCEFSFIILGMVILSALKDAKP